MHYRLVHNARQVVCFMFQIDDELCDTQNEPLCDPTTCAFSGTRHIAWNIRLRAPDKYWWTPSIGLHFFMWVIPVLTICQIKPTFALILTMRTWRGMDADERARVVHQAQRSLVVWQAGAKTRSGLVQWGGRITLGGDGVGVRYEVVHYCKMIFV